MPIRSGVKKCLLNGQGDRKGGGGGGGGGSPVYPLENEKIEVQIIILWWMPLVLKQTLHLKQTENSEIKITERYIQLCVI